MTAVPIAVVEVLNDLLDAELNSPFRFMDEGSPYLSRATVEVRKPLAEMLVALERRAGELYALIEGLGGTPVRRGLRPEEQYLAYLSLKFLLPKLVEAKELAIRRYQTAAESIRRHPDRPTGVLDVLLRHIAEKKAELKALEHAAAQVASSK